jgi:hypothetical protein
MQEGLRKMSFDRSLLEAYRNLWSNRSLEASSDEMKTLCDAIERDLRDEHTHPRLRKKPEQKFFYAMKRISASGLSDQEKAALMDLHIKVAEERIVLT